MMLFPLLLFIIYFFLTSGESIEPHTENMCNFKDINIQPDTFRHISKIIPPKMNDNTKGDHGKIAVIGGSTEYAGAPYFAAITALKSGADLVYVITTESASPIIKSYSPDLIVYPYLSPKYASKIRALLPKFNVIVIGNGIGREEEALRLVYSIIADCKQLRKPLVIDADALFAIARNSSVLKNYPCPGAILTPNVREASKLMESIPRNNQSNWYNYWGECVTVLLKGDKDILHSHIPTYEWAATGGGSGRRVAGQGDILAGALATFYNWALKADFCKNENHTLLAQSVSAYAAAKLTRLSNYKAFEALGCSMIASDMLNQIHPAFDIMFH